MNTEKLVYFIVDNFLLYLFKSSKPCVIVGSGLVKYLKRKKKSKFNNLRCLYYKPFFFFLCIYVNQIYKYASLIHIKHLKQIIRYNIGYYTTVALAGVLLSSQKPQQIKPTHLTCSSLLQQRMYLIRQ